MLERKKTRPKILLSWIAMGTILLTGIWILLQTLLPGLMESFYFRFLLNLIFGFGFLIIAWKLKFG